MHIRINTLAENTKYKSVKIQDICIIELVCSKQRNNIYLKIFTVLNNIIRIFVLNIKEKSLK